jgi:23S rRNA (adenine2503-C2)-methyltransferase
MPAGKGQIIAFAPGGRFFRNADLRTVAGSIFMDPKPLELLGLDLAELCQKVTAWGEKSFHGRQLYRAIYSRYQVDFGEMTDLSQSFRKKLPNLARITWPRLHTMQCSADGTRKFLFDLEDHEKIESVFIPEKKRNTLCISTQVGCEMGCQFCLTAQLGFARNLTAGEIVGQILFILKQSDPDATASHPSKPTNLVLMGMGEPLLNLEAVTKALQLITDPGGLSIPARRITLSTVGIVHNLQQLAEAPVIPQLAISLSATTDQVRGRLMPINKKYPIATLLEACRQFPLAPRQHITFEYVLIDGINDTDEDARRLVRLLARLRAKVNLLPLNPGQAGPLRPSPMERVLRFQEILTSKGLPAYIRRPRGADIFAACGQLHGAQAKLEECEVGSAKGEAGKMTAGEKDSSSSIKRQRGPHGTG